MSFAKIIDGVVVKFPYTLQDARQEYPNVSFPANINVIPEDSLNTHDIFSVTQKPDPAFSPDTQRLVQGTPVYANGVYEVTRVVEALSQAEIDDIAVQKSLEEDSAALKADAQVTSLLGARPNQINTYIENNVTNLAQAKDVLKILARALAVVGHRSVR